MKRCDNESVGVLLWNDEGELALIERGRFPVGFAPPAGHIDEHGGPELAAVEEVWEEVGVRLAVDGLHKTAIQNRRVDNVCRRPGGDHHNWNVYEAFTNDELHGDPQETKSARWHGRDKIQQLAERTRQYQGGVINEDDWVARPGLEPVWLDFMVELGQVE